MPSLPLPSGFDETPTSRVANGLHSVAIHLLRWVRVVDRETGLTPERLSLLSVVAFAGPKTVSELAEAEQVSSPAISRILNGLEEEGLVTRRRSERDRRYVHVRVTARGKRVIEAARARRLERISSRLDPLDEAELETLAAAVRILERVERGGPPA